MAIGARRGQIGFCIRSLSFRPFAQHTLSKQLEAREKCARRNGVWSERKREREKGRNAVDNVIFFFRAGKEFFSVDFILSFLRRIYFRSHREGYWKSFFLSRSQPPNVYGPLFSHIQFVGRSFAQFECMKVYCLQSGSVFIIPSLHLVRMLQFISFVLSLHRSHDSLKLLEEKACAVHCRPSMTKSLPCNIIT